MAKYCCHLMLLVAFLTLPFQSYSQLEYDQSEDAEFDTQELTSEEPVDSAVDAPGSNDSESTQVITGEVVSEESGEHLSGVLVVERGSDKSTTTDAAGRFSIKASQGSTLIFSSSGFVEKTVTVSEDNISVALSKIEDLEKLVVIGYGTTKKKNLSSSVGTMDVGNLSKSGTGRIDDALQGQIAGVSVVSGGNGPGSDMKVNIRGISTVSLDDQPLYIIDGVMADGRAFSALRSSDIENLQVLKDAATAAIYGSRAANGVILVTTKRGSKGEPKVTVSSEVKAQSVAKLFDMQNTDEYKEYLRQYYAKKDANGNFIGYDTAQMKWALDNVPDANTDWQSEMYRTALIHNHNASIEGGNEAGRVFFSLGYTGQQGVMIETDHEQINARINTELKKGPVKIGESMSLSHSKRKHPYFQSSAVDIAKTPPSMPVYDPSQEDGYGAPLVSNVGPSANRVNQVLAANAWDITTNREAVLANVFMEVALSDRSLVYRSDLNFNGDVESYRQYNDKIDNGQAAMNKESALTERKTLRHSINPENYLTMQNSFGENDLSGVAGLSINMYKTDMIQGMGTHLYNGTYSLSGSSTGVDGNGSITEGSSLSMFARLNYNYSSLLLLGASFRRDGSSAFSPENRWGNFPGLSAGFNVHELPFLDNNDIISEMKLRGGWGVLGRSGGNYWSVMNTSIEYVIDEKLAPGLAPTDATVPDLKWEAVKQLDLGADLGFFNKQLTVNADFFRNKSEDMLVRVQLPLYSGLKGSKLENLGSVQNTGFELSVGARKSISDFSFGASSNLSIIRNIVLSLGNDTFPQYGNESSTITRVGDPIGLFWGHEVVGIFDTQEEIAAAPTQIGARVGDFQFKDVNGDGKIDNDSDRTVIGNPWPDFTAGLNLSAQYKGFDLSAGITAVYGNDILNRTKRVLTGTYDENAWSSHLRDMNDAWTGPGTSDEIPVVSPTDPNNNNRISSRYIEDGSYIRLKNVELGYTVPVGKLGVNSARIYLSASNLFTFTRYSGLDPDVTGSEILDRGIDHEQRSYPSSRIFGMGTQISF